MEELKSYLLLTGTGAVLILTADDLDKNPELLKNLVAGSLNKFVAYDIPIDSVKASYKAHFEHTLRDPFQNNEFKVLDDDGVQIFNNIKLKELGNAMFFEEGSAFKR
jgi:hypothetical protein